MLAAGGIGNARLLLLGNTDHPGGIGNQHDLVGRFFMEHLALRSGVVSPSGSGGCSERHDLWTVTEAGGVSGLPIFAPSEEVLREQGLLNTYFILEPKPHVFAADAVRSGRVDVCSGDPQPAANAAVSEEGRSCCGRRAGRCSSPAGVAPRNAGRVTPGTRSGRTGPQP